MSLTERQQAVLGELRKIGRENLFRYKQSSAYLFGGDCEKVHKGDAHCVFGLGGLSFQVGSRLGLTAGAVLAVFKSLERKNMVIREMRNPSYQRPLYWWPVGLAETLAAEVSK